MKFQQATISLVIELMAMAAANIKNQTTDKERTKEFRDKGDNKTYIVLKKINLKRLLKTICKSFVENRKYNDVWYAFCYATENAKTLGILNDMKGDPETLGKWREKGVLPAGFKSYPDFYDNTTVTLCIKKVV
jgi:hypothetical protein